MMDFKKNSSMAASRSPIHKVRVESCIEVYIIINIYNNKTTTRPRLSRGMWLMNILCVKYWIFIDNQAVFQSLTYAGRSNPFPFLTVEKMFLSLAGFLY